MFSSPLKTCRRGPRRVGLVPAALVALSVFGAAVAAPGEETVFPVVPVRLIRTVADFRQPGPAEGTARKHPFRLENSILDNSESFFIRREAVLPGVLLDSPRRVVVIGLSWLWREFSGKNIDVRVLLPEAEVPYVPVGIDERIGLMTAEPAHPQPAYPPTGIAVRMSAADQGADTRWVCVPGEDTFRICRARDDESHGLIHWEALSDQGTPPLMLPVFDSSGAFRGFCRPQPNPMAAPSEWPMIRRSQVERSVRKLLQVRGNIQSGYLGVFVEDILPRKAGQGVLVKGVTDGSPAQAAGMVPGDIILRINADRVSSTREFIQVIQGMSPDTPVNLETLRGGKALRLETTLARVPVVDTPSTPFLLPSEPAVRGEGTAVTPASAVRFKTRPSDRPSIGIFMSAPKAGDRPGARVSFVLPNSPAEQAGIRPGDILLEIDGNLVQGPQDVSRIVAAAARGEALTLTVSRAGGQLTVQASPR